MHKNVILVVGVKQDKGDQWPLSAALHLICLFFSFGIITGLFFLSFSPHLS